MRGIIILRGHCAFSGLNFLLKNILFIIYNMFLILFSIVVFICLFRKFSLNFFVSYLLLQSLLHVSLEYTMNNVRIDTLNFYLPYEALVLVTEKRIQLVGWDRFHEENDFDVSLINNYVFLFNVFQRIIN